MINSVRNTVLSILNKNNYGYISPQDFNLFAKQAQLEVFESYFSTYNTQINKENSRASGTEYADSTKGLEESINYFSVTKALDQNAYNKYYTPSVATTGDLYYLINKVLVFTTFRVSGAAGTPSANKLIDAGATFTTDVTVGDIATNTVTLMQAEVMAVDSDTSLTLSEDIFDTLSDAYYIYADVSYEAEKVSNSKISMLKASLLTAPNTTYPAYSLGGGSMTVLPKTANRPGQVYSQYIRYPKDPQWTYSSLSSGQPVFDQSQASYQDFELALDDEVMLVTKIVGLAAMQIRETQVVQFGNAEEQKQNQQ